MINQIDLSRSKLLLNSAHDNRAMRFNIIRSCATLNKLYSSAILAFIIREYDAGEAFMYSFASLIHTVFNLGLDIPWEDDNNEVRNFESIDSWVSYLNAHGFSQEDDKLCQNHDPSLNTLIRFVKQSRSLEPYQAKLGGIFFHIVF